MTGTYGFIVIGAGGAGEAAAHSHAFPTVARVMGGLFAKVALQLR